MCLLYQNQSDVDMLTRWELHGRFPVVHALRLRWQTLMIDEVFAHHHEQSCGPGSEHAHQQVAAKHRVMKEGEEGE